MTTENAPLPERLYGDLHNARERLCRAQTDVPWPGQRDHLGECIETIDRIGVFLFPDRWSRYDEPTTELG